MYMYIYIYIYICITTDIPYPPCRIISRHIAQDRIRSHNHTICVTQTVYMSITHTCHTMSQKRESDIVCPSSHTSRIRYTPHMHHLQATPCHNIRSQTYISHMLYHAQTEGLARVLTV